MKTYCINLKHRTDRRSDMQKQFDSVNSLQYEFIDAVFGADKCCCPVGFSSYNTYACVLSHLKALELAKENDIALIIEDDIEFVDGFDIKLENLLSNLPKEWDIVYLATIPNNMETLETIDGFYIANGQWGGLSYLVNKNTIEKVIREVNQKTFVFDQHLINLHQDKKCFIAKPFLCTIKEYDYSDIQDKVVNYPELKSKYI